MSSSKQRKDPSVLVTDSRSRTSPRRALQRQDTAPTPMRFMTVDNVLQFNTQIPSGQPRQPPTPYRPQSASAAVSSSLSARRTPSGGIATAQSRTGKPMPSRTTKISEKLVLLPETAQNDDDEELEENEAHLARRMQDEDNLPLNDEELDVLRRRGGIRGKSYAERLPKMQRAEKVSRVTAYCTAQAFKIKSTAEFLRKKHEAKTKLYDDCLYVMYSLPLLNGTEGYRIRSRPILKTPGSGKTVLDLEIERSEWRGPNEGYFEDDAYSKPGSPATHLSSTLSSPSSHFNEVENTSQMSRLTGETKNLAEMFVFSYGVVVFWNFTENQEKDVLADLTFADAEDCISLLTRPLSQEDYETEEFHFEYSADVKRPRVFNDMITLVPRSDHMIKLTISHAIAQSTKLCFFEERMSETMQDAQHIPKTLALTGELNMTRIEIIKITGRLFKSRVDINLLSNILDVPNFFWDSEPTLHPLYAAIREYLEIDPRTKVLNERCRVFLDLAEILSDSIADSKMTGITWIIIILIVVSILVTVTEVVLRFAMLTKNKDMNASRLAQCHNSSLDSLPPQLQIGPPTGMGMGMAEKSELDSLAELLGIKGNATMEDIRKEISQLKRRTEDQ